MRTCGILALLLSLLAVPALAQEHNNACQLQVIVKGVVTKAAVEIAVFGTAESFADFESPVTTATLQPVADAVEASFSVPSGRYAISVFQDSNGNRQLDSNFLGIPTEKYGFSGNGGQFGPPSFDAAAANCVGSLIVTIQL